ncbi:hypothetical protein [Methanogenium cariaci]|uniref:hypothetical protein n=1 Tax=Methanogenium cariaci TaxID=2197 RepID=UPI00078619B4|nr:hypothetical protein [Methanogenium cariaci]
MKGKNRRFAGYRLEDIWADPDEIQGMIETMEMTYPGMGGKVFVITEGPYDLEVYDRCFNTDTCILRIANSKENVCDIVEGIRAGSARATADGGEDHCSTRGGNTVSSVSLTGTIPSLTVH